jgi:hypothetical protein
VARSIYCLDNAQNHFVNVYNLHCTTKLYGEDGSIESFFITTLVYRNICLIHYIHSSNLYKSNLSSLYISFDRLNHHRFQIDNWNTLCCMATVSQTSPVLWPHQTCSLCMFPHCRVDFLLRDSQRWDSQMTLSLQIEPAEIIDNAQLGSWWWDIFLKGRRKIPDTFGILIWWEESDRCIIRCDKTWIVVKCNVLQIDGKAVTGDRITHVSLHETFFKKMRHSRKRTVT